MHEDETPLNSSLLSPLVSPSSVGSGGVGMEGAGGMQRVRSTASMTVPVTENDPLGALTPPANHQSPTNKGLVKSATCPNNDLYNVGNNRAKTPVKTGEFLFLLPSLGIGCQIETTVALLVVLRVNIFFFATTFSIGPLQKLGKMFSKP